MAITVAIIGSQNSQWQLSASTSGPAITRPMPPPNASSATAVPIGAGDLLARELVADDAEGQRQHATADALDDPRQRSAPRSTAPGAAIRGAHRERAERDDEHPLLADLVADRGR